MTVLQPEIHHFDERHFGTMSELIEAARSGRQDFLLLACSDQSGLPGSISFADPDQFVVVQNLAASVARPGETDAFLGSIEFAMAVHEIQHIILCGHTCCSVLANLAQRRSRDLCVCRTLSIVEQHYPQATDREFFELLVQEHMLLQLENLQSHRFISKQLATGQLSLHAWLVDDQTARVRAFDPEAGQFTQ
tara:strand:- start:82460 stop:83035 length:576 start_codon:yes stop_codon:yes gene_type:complete